MLYIIQALRQEYNVNISGGSDKAQIYASFGYLDEDGIAEGSDYSRITGRLKTTYQAKPWMRFGANISYTHSTQNSAAGGFSQAFNTAPIYPLYLRDTNGKIMQDKNGDMYDFGVSNQSPLNRPINPNSNGIKLSQLDTYNTSANTLNGDAFIDVNFLKDFKFTFNAGTSIRDSRYKNALNPFYGTANSLNGSINVQHWRRTTLNLQQILNYNHSFGLHNVSLMAGHESFNNVYEELYAAKNSMFSFFRIKN